MTDPYVAGAGHGLDEAVLSTGMKLGISALVAGTLSLGAFLGGVALGSSAATPSADTLAVVGAGNGARAWFDEPVGDTVAPFAPISITAHAADPMGVESFELTVNGAALPTDSFELFDAGESLAYLKFTWAPPGFGSFVLAVTGFDAAGNPGDPAAVLITVQEPEAEVTTTTQGTTTTTSSSTTTSTTTTQPADTSGPTITRVAAAPTQIYQGLGRCGPLTVAIRADISDPSGIGTAELRYRLVFEGVASDDPFATLPMVGSGDTYSVELASADLPEISAGGGVPLPQAIVEFFVVASDGLGNLSQSPPDATVEVDRC